MRSIIRIAGVAAAGFVMVLGVSHAADPYGPVPESRAYIGFSFGGARVAPRALHYGLRMDHDSHFVELEGQRLPLMQLDFTSRGLADARLNGLSILRSDYRMRQAEESPPEEGGEAPVEQDAPAEEAPAEAAAAGSGDCGFFCRLFGGEDDEAAESAEAPADAAPAEEAPAETADAAPEPIAEGTFMGFGIVDWTLLAAAAVGIGLAATEVNNGDEAQDPQGGVPPVNGGPGSPGSGEPCIIPPNVLDPNGTPDGCDPNAFAGRQAGLAGVTVDVDYQAWLDGGTGHMGDLGD